jgi:hypothetical protein
LIGDTTYYASSDSVIWLDHITTDSSTAIAFKSNSEFNCSITVEVKRFSGICGSLSLLDSLETQLCSGDALFSFPNQAIGDTFYFQVSISGNSSAIEMGLMNLPCACITLPTNSCDLICNGDFEENSGVSSWFSFLDVACPWNNLPVSPPTVPATFSTADHIYGTPTGIFTGTTIYSGSAMASGIMVNGIIPIPGNDRENIQQELMSPIVSGDIVFVRFYARVSERSEHIVKQLGAHFSNAQIIYSSGGQSLIGLQQHVANNPSNPIATTWQEVGGIVQNTSQNNWNWITIGNFLDNSVSGNVLNNPAANPSSSVSGARYVFDAVEVVKLPTAGPDITSVCPNEPFVIGLVGCTIPTGVSIQWTDASNNILGTTATISHSEPTSGTYTYTMTISYNGYSFADQVTVHVQNNLAVSILNPFGNALPVDACDDTNFQFNVQNPISGYTYTWYDQSNSVLGTGVSVTLALGLQNSSISGVYVVGSNGYCTANSNTILIDYCCTFGVVNHIFNGTLSTSLSANYFNGTQTIIHGIFWVDDDFIMNNAHVYLDDDAEIFVMADATLTIENSILEACGLDLWAQISVGTDATLEVDNSIFRDAYSAITVSSNGILILTGQNLFENNHTGISFLQPTNTFAVNNCTFRSTGNLLSPFSNQIGEFGIMTKYIDQGTIGSFGNGNTFENLHYGIYHKDDLRGITISHNEFTDIMYNQPTVERIIPKAAIWIDHDLNTSSVITINENNFIHCGIGILRQKRVGSLTIHANHFEEISLIGILSQYANLDGNIITHNTFDKIAEGIIFTGNNDIQLILRFNVFTNPTKFPRSRAIYKSNISDLQGEGNVLIEENEIHDFPSGIHIVNQKEVIIRENNVLSVYANANVMTEGIRLENCRRARVTCNFVESQLQAPYSVAGIRTSASPQQWVVENYFSKLGRTVQSNGISSNSRFLNNTLIDSQEGFYLNVSSIGPQIASWFNTATNLKEMRPQDNMWISQFISHIVVNSSDGSLSPFYYRDNSPIQWHLDNNSIIITSIGTSTTPSPFIAISSNSPLSYYLCNTSFTPEENESGDHILSQTQIAEMLDTMSVSVYEPDDAALQWLYAQNLYRDLALDTTDFSNNQLLVDFFDLAGQDEIGEIENIEELINEALENGSLLAAGVNPAIWEAWDNEAFPVKNYHAFYIIYVPLVDERDSTLLEIDSITVHVLDSLASLCPMFHGLAVYQARALLDAIGIFEYNPSSCEYAVPTLENKKEDEPLEEGDCVLVYPNPSRDYIYVLKSRGQQEHLSLTLRNSIGVVVNKLDMRELDTYVKLDISELIPGIYYLEVENDSNKEVHCVIVQ